MTREKPPTKKTETLTLRLDPKSKFAIELLARDQKRTLAGVIEWAVQKALNDQIITTGYDEGSLKQLVEQVWSVDELERVIRLGAFAEHLLSHEEACTWMVIKNNPVLFEVVELDSQGRIRKFRIRNNRVSYARKLIAQRAQELADTGKFDPITYDQINQASNGDLQSIESFEKKVAEVQGEPEGWGDFS